MKRIGFFLRLLAASLALGSWELLPTAGQWAPKDGRNSIPSLSGDFISSLFQSFTNGKSGEGGFQEILQKLAAGVDPEIPADFAEGPIEGLFENLPDMKEFMKNAKGKGGASAPLKTPALQSLVEKFMSDSGVDGGLLDRFKDLQQLTEGPLDLKKLVSTFRSLSKTLKAHGTDMNALLEEVLGGAYAQVPPVAPPEEMKRLESSTSAQVLKDSLRADIVRPQSVSLKTIRSSIGTFTEELPGVPTGPHCVALVLSGGIARAPLQAGAILGLAEQYAAREKALKWDVVAGVNKGALSAITSLGFRPGQNGEIDWARFLWSIWHRLNLESFMRCPRGLNDLLNLPRIVEWLADAEASLSSKGADPANLPTPHDCDLQAAADTILEIFNEMPEPADSTADVGNKGRVAVVTAARIGGGTAAWEFTDIGSEQSCVAAPDPPLSVYTSCQRENLAAAGAPTVSSTPKTERGLTLRALLATNATPGIATPVRLWPQGAHREAYMDGRVMANLSVGEAVRACQKKLRREALAEEDVRKGRGVFIDIVGTVPLSQPEVESQLQDIAEKLRLTKSSKRHSLNKLPASRLIKQIKKSFPLATVRHVLFPEKHFELMSDYGDFRGSHALLQHGRIMGWRATTLDDVE
ncbi:patatin-like phospholipase domain-containing protein [Cyclospora cayetanensis]|uniref:Patatin-like phospholipase domain-containing protein n=1 Tax=Cyclospora cayetanensis TaxID=88456 RepID=A0A1D3CU02_9EIME|nr:patatin-like phospholipase domain-containing protein [Cyclospora cayetanensis]